MKYLSIVALGATVMMGASCNAQSKSDDGFAKFKDGLEYKIVAPGNGTQEGKIGDICELGVTMTVGDSLVFSSYKLNNNQPVQQPLSKPGGRGDIMEALLKMKPGDSAIMRMDADTFSKNLGQPRPDWLKSGKQYVTWNVKMYRILSQEELAKEAALRSAKQNKIDEGLILDYFKKNNITNYKKTTSGLYYTVAKAGDGVLPKAGQTVTVNYTGKLLSGEKFDSNTDPDFKHVEPFKFPLGQHRVIAGWDEIVGLMSKGEKLTVYIPSSLGYGDRGAGPKIGPNQVLIFDIELTSFE